MLIGLYENRIFKAALLECFNKLNAKILEDKETNGQIEAMRAGICKQFMSEELGFNTSNWSIGSIVMRLNNTRNKFLRECGETCERIAEANREDCEVDENLRDAVEDMADDAEPELSEEDKKIIDNVFDVNAPVEIDEIRDSMVDALEKERQVAEEMESAIDLARQDAEMNGEDVEEAVSEAANRMIARQPVTLIGALSYAAGQFAITELSKNNDNGIMVENVRSILKQNGDMISTQVCILYSL